MKNLTKTLIITCACLWLFKEILLPITVATMYSNEYMNLTYECDTAMEAGWYYRQDNLIDKSSESVQLLACHDYDKTRKLMLMSGLNEDYLAWLGLQSLELYQRPAEEFVQQHRFTQR